MVISAFYSQFGASTCKDCGMELDWTMEHYCSVIPNDGTNDGRGRNGGGGNDARGRNGGGYTGRDPFQPSSPILHSNQPNLSHHPPPIHSQSQYPICGTCNLPITSNSDSFEIPVLGKHYHADCFSCKSCGVLFDDMNPYVPFEGDAFCERCFVQAELPQTQMEDEICAACNKPITAKDRSTNGASGAGVLYAFGRAFHARHLRCGGCKKSVKDGFVEQDGKVWCRSCQSGVGTSRSGSRNGGGVVVVGGTLPPSPRLRNENHGIPPSPRLRTNAPQPPEQICNGCNRVVKGDEDAIQAAGKIYHRGCFTCTGCHTTLPRQYYTHQSKPYCIPCYHEETNTICAECNGFITGECVDVDEFRCKFHKECWRCSVCECMLTDTYYSFKGRVYCEKDVDQAMNGMKRPEKRTTLLRGGGGKKY
jgi:hypothetical protein